MEIGNKGIKITYLNNMKISRKIELYLNLRLII